MGASVSTPLNDYKKSIISIIEEYFSTGDVDQAASDLRDLHSQEYHQHFVKKLVSMAMDRHDKEKEMSTVLLSALYADVITSAHVSQGFLMLLESADDLALDIVDAVDVLALFIARAIVDDILPPAFLKKAKEKLPETSKGFQAVQTSEKSYLLTPHHAELVERKWGGSTHITVEEVKKKITDLLREYSQNGDMVEACRCIRDLGVSFFHHEVVKKAIILSMEVPSSKNLIVKLLKETADEGLISFSQMARGFLRVSDDLDDLSLDIPQARAMFQSLAIRGETEGWLEPTEITIAEKKLWRYKEEAIAIIQEYFLSDDIPELIRSLVDLAAPENYPIFLKKLVTLALDKRNREKEMTSVLITALRSELFSSEDLIKGFIMILEDADDTALDILDVSDEIAFFIARAVIDDSLVPLELVEMTRQLKRGSMGSEILRLAKTLVCSTHAGERLLRCWGGGSGWAVEDAKDKVTRLLEEYESGGDMGEACQCIRDLDMPFFGHEVVKKALIMAMEKKREMILALLEECLNEGLITVNQMTKGFSRVRDSLEDLTLDVPDARDKFLAFKALADDKGWLLPSFA